MMEYHAHVAANDFRPGRFVTLGYSSWVDSLPKPRPATGDTVRPNFIMTGLGDVWHVVDHTGTTIDLVNGEQALRLVMTTGSSGLNIPGPTTNWIITELPDALSEPAKS